MQNGSCKCKIREELAFSTTEFDVRNKALAAQKASVILSKIFRLARVLH